MGHTGRLVLVRVKGGIVVTSAVAILIVLVGVLVGATVSRWRAKFIYPTEVLMANRGSQVSRCIASGQGISFLGLLR